MMEMAVLKELPSAENRLCRDLNPGVSQTYFDSRLRYGQTRGSDYCCLAGFKPHVSADSARRLIPIGIESCRSLLRPRVAKRNRPPITRPPGCVSVIGNIRHPRMLAYQDGPCGHLDPDNELSDHCKSLLHHQDTDNGRCSRNSQPRHRPAQRCCRRPARPPAHGRCRSAQGARHVAPSERAGQASADQCIERTVQVSQYY